MTQAREEYRLALKKGQKEYRDLTQRGLDPYPAVLDDILSAADTVQELPLVEIPAQRIVGTKSAGRTSAFTAGFMPLLGEDSEFAMKWARLCAAHLSDEGLRDPIVCYEYLGNFYVQEGNKRVSVLRHFGAARIPALVRRILPHPSDDPQIVAYYEFLDFYQACGLYDVQYRQPGDYARLLAELGKEPGEGWEERERRTFRAYFQYFREAFAAMPDRQRDIRPEEALLLWLRVYPFADLGKLTATELKKTLAALWPDVSGTPVELHTGPEAPKGGILKRLRKAGEVQVAFVHQRDTESRWIRGHEEGRKHLEEVLGEQVSCRSYFHADTPELADEILEQAVAEGADVIFTTTPQLATATVKAALKYPRVRMLNCSVNVPFSKIRTYYSRIYEAKFITGAIAGAIAKNGRIGYVATYPIYGVPASINAFALGAQMTNPRVKIDLRWSCLPGSPVQALIRDGIRVISNRNMPTSEQLYLEFGEYGTYQVGEGGSLTTLGVPCWVWGKFYETVVRAVLSGDWDRTRETRPVNYWWGMDSGVIDVKFGENLPPSVLALAEILRSGLQKGTIDPFLRPITDQAGRLRTAGDMPFSADELLHMDWLCENVEGSIPEFEDILPFARATVRELGIHREKIPVKKEGAL